MRFRILTFIALAVIGCVLISGCTQSSPQGTAPVTTAAPSGEDDTGSYGKPVFPDCNDREIYDK